MIHVGDAMDVLPTLPSSSIHCCVTSPPYYAMRDYGVPGQIGLETTVDEYVERLVAVFAQVRRVLQDDGTLWLNVGDCYASTSSYNAPRSFHSLNGWKQPGRSPNANASRIGYKAKDLLGIPWTVAFVLRADGWYLRSEIVWAKAAPIPESVKDRPSSAHEKIFLLSKSSDYFYDYDAVKEPATSPPRSLNRSKNDYNESYPGGRFSAGSRPYNLDGMRAMRNVWWINSVPFHGAHFAVFPEELARRCILAGCPADGTVIDPFLGSGTTAVAARNLDRKWVGIEIDPEMAALARDRVDGAYRNRPKRKDTDGSLLDLIVEDEPCTT